MFLNVMKVLKIKFFSSKTFSNFYFKFGNLKKKQSSESSLRPRFRRHATKTDTQISHHEEKERIGGKGRDSKMSVEIGRLKLVSVDELPRMLKHTENAVDAKTLAQSKQIVDDVRNRGIDGLIEHSVRLGDLKNKTQSIEVSKEEMRNAYHKLPKEQRGALQRMADRIRSFAKAQRDSLRDLTTEIPGGKAGHVVSAVKTAGCYAPGGRYPLPSSVLMTAITARVAGVKNVWVASPRPAIATMAAAYLAGVDGMLRIGGAQAIACFAYGVGPVPAADVIVGPGNRWVTAAKQLVSGRVGIDMLAGPSECLVIADRTASPDVIAADLLAQAEHDTDARPILIASGYGANRLVSDVNESLAKQLKTLPTASTAREALARAGFAVITSNINQAIRVTDMIAPEHLEVMTKDSDEISRQLSCYGGLFVGTQSAEVMGDYGAGPNHVLPTGGTGRYTGGLSVFTFLAIRTWMRLDQSNEDGISEVVSDAVTVARMEGLEGHARAASFRLPPSKRRKIATPPSSL